MTRHLFSVALLVCMLVAGSTGTVMQSSAVPVLHAQTPGVFETPVAYPADIWMSGNLTSVEIEDLTAQQDAQMFQRDTYRLLAATYLTMPMFETMAQEAEVLLEYGNRLHPGHGALEPGTYSRGDLRQLFTRYVGSAGTDLSEGLGAAALTEDMHIAGLLQVMSRTSNPELQELYALQLAVSRNNLRKIGRSMELRGLIYSPHYLDEKTYADIMMGPFEPVTLPDTAPLASAAIFSAGIAPIGTMEFQEDVAMMPATPLSEAEIQDIIFLQELEQFDRDLYSALAGQHPAMPVFSTLARAAGAEMTADNVILARYNINYTPLDPGRFRNENLQIGFRNFLTNQSGLPTDALATAAESEEWHIAALTTGISRTSHPDLRFIYNEQLVLSRNSLREIDRELRSRGGTYAPQYLSEEVYNAIIGSPVEVR